MHQTVSITSCLFKQSKKCFITLMASSLLTLTGGCQQSLAESSHSSKPKGEHPTADLILTDGVIFTADANNQLAQALAIKDGLIIAVGQRDKVMSYAGQHTKIEALQGAMVLPGIHDSHVHVLEAGSEVGGNCWLEPVENFRDYGPQLKACARKARGSEWLLAYGHDLEALMEATEHPAQLLDQLVGDRPVAIMEQTSHSSWVNSKALSLAGYTRKTQDPSGGVIVRDAHGHPNGILLETASERIFDLALQPSQVAFELNYDGLLWSLEQLAQNGITSFSDARVYWKRGWMEVWKQAEKDGKLTARANLGLWAYPTMNDQEQLKILRSMYEYNPDGLLQVNQIKLYSDGIIHNTTAALKAPYVEGSGPFPENLQNQGLNYFSQSRIQTYIESLQDVGFDFHIHAIGDRGVHEALNAIEAAQNYGNRHLKQRRNTDYRHRLTHVEMIDDADLPRFSQLNVIADMQVAGEFTHPHNHKWQAPYIGDRAYNAYRLNDLQQSGAKVVLSSDWTVSPLNPFIGIQSAVDRGEQSITLRQAIKAYTINAAYLMRQENETGSLEVGKAADLIVIDRNLFEIKTSEISQTKVLLTMLEGETVWKSRDW